MASDSRLFGEQGYALEYNILFYCFQIDCFSRIDLDIKKAPNYIGALYNK